VLHEMDLYKLKAKLSSHTSPFRTDRSNQSIPFLVTSSPKKLRVLHDSVAIMSRIDFCDYGHG
jgi:hypothetical protein